MVYPDYRFSRVRSHQNKTQAACSRSKAIVEVKKKKSKKSCIIRRCRCWMRWSGKYRRDVKRAGTGVIDSKGERLWITGSGMPLIEMILYQRRFDAHVTVKSCFAKPNI